MEYVILDTEICNCKFYDGENGLKDNAVVVSNLSGRTVAYLANDRFTETKSLKLTLDTSGSNSEYKKFKTWYTNTLGGIAGVFKCSALGTQLWRFTENPTEDNGQRFKTLSISIEEAL